MVLHGPQWGPYFGYCWRSCKMFCDPFYIVDKGMSSWEKEVDISVAFVLGLLFFSLGSWLTIRIRILIWMGLNGPSYWRCRLIVCSLRGRFCDFCYCGSRWFGVLARICWFRIMWWKCESEYSFLIVFSRFLIEWSWFWLRIQVGIVSRSVRFIYHWVELPDN